MNATVSDGRFSVTVGVTVQVEQATDEMVQSAVTLRFQDLSPEDFVGLYLQDVKRALRTALGRAGPGAGVVAQTPDPLHILGVQPVGRSSQLEVLLAVEALDGGYVGPGELALRLGEVREQLRGPLKVRDATINSLNNVLQHETRTISF